MIKIPTKFLFLFLTITIILKDKFCPIIFFLFNILKLFRIKIVYVRGLSKRVLPRLWRVGST